LAVRVPGPVTLVVPVSPSRFPTDADPLTVNVPVLVTDVVAEVGPPVVLLRLSVAPEATETDATLPVAVPLLNVRVPRATEMEVLLS
jgi:hypothetical protein